MVQRIAEATPADDISWFSIVLLGAFTVIVIIVLALQSGETELDRKKYILDVATFVTIFAYAGITVLLWLTQGDTNRINQEIFIATNRLWISVNGAVDDPLHIDSTGVNVRIDWRLKNHGHTPAQEVEVWPEAYLFGSPVDSSQGRATNPSDVQEFWCRMHISMPPKHGRGMGFVIFPDEERIAGVSTTIDRKQADETAKFNKQDPPAIQIIVVGCVTYTFEGSDRRHQTGFLYLLSEIDPRRVESPWHSYHTR